MKKLFSLQSIIKGAFSLFRELSNIFLWVGLFAAGVWYGTTPEGIEFVANSRIEMLDFAFIILAISVVISIAINGLEWLAERYNLIGEDNGQEKGLALQESN